MTWQPIFNQELRSAARMERYNKRHEPEQFLDLFYPGWRDNMAQWPPKDEKCPCERCNV